MSRERVGRAEEEEGEKGEEGKDWEIESRSGVKREETRGKR